MSSLIKLVLQVAILSGGFALVAMWSQYWIRKGLVVWMAIGFVGCLCIVAAMYVTSIWMWGIFEW